MLLSSVFNGCKCAKNPIEQSVQCLKKVWGEKGYWGLGGGQLGGQGVSLHSCSVTNL